MSEEPDVLIVGGILVGLSTALFLRLQGVSCLAVERHTSTAIHPRAGHFQLRTVEILRSAGLEEAVRRKGEQQYHPNGGINNVESLAGREIASYFANLNAGVEEFSPTVRLFIDQDALGHGQDPPQADDDRRGIRLRPRPCPQAGQGHAPEPADAVPRLVARTDARRVCRSVRAVRRRPDADARGGAGARADGLSVHPDRRPRLRSVDRSVAADGVGGGRDSFERVMTEGADMLNEMASVPGVTFGLHICKGNYDSHWISAGGYESIAGHLFSRLGNYDRVLLEYENERSGTFEPLRELPGDKVVVLGLVSSKFNELESPEQLIGRIEEAARFYPRDQLALSTQCGFASAGPGNAISEDAEERKLRLIAEVAARVWG